MTAVLFSIGKFAIGYYLGKSAFSSVYGIAGSFLVLLLWSYYTAQNLFVRRGIHTVLFFNFGHTRFASFTALKLGSSDHRILVCTLAHRARTPGPVQNTVSEQAWLAAAEHSITLHLGTTWPRL